MKITIEPDEDFPWEAFNEPFLYEGDGKQLLLMLAFNKELGHDEEILVIEIGGDMPEAKARKLAEKIRFWGNAQGQANDEAGL